LRTRKQLEGDIALYLRRYTTDSAVMALLSVSIGRILLKGAGASGHLDKSRRTDIAHFTDWLTSSVINRAEWLRKVDERGRPRKLLKLGTIDAAVAEANRAMIVEAKRNASVRLRDGEEVLYRELEDGFRIVRLLTAAALDREGHEMQHCIGGGAYDGHVREGTRMFFSLRDRFGRAHATLETKTVDGPLLQLQGKQNARPAARYLDRLAPFIVAQRWHLGATASALGFIVAADGRWHPLDRLPETLEVDHDLDLEDLTIDLPSHLKVTGTLRLAGCVIGGRAETIEVGRSCIMQDNDIGARGIAAVMRVNGMLLVSGSLTRAVCDDLDVKGFVSLAAMGLERLPLRCRAGEGFSMCDNACTSLPSDLLVDGDIVVHTPSITALPDTLVLKGSLDIAFSGIQTLGGVVHVPGHLNIGGSAIARLPDGLRVDGNMLAGGSALQGLPDGLTVGGRLDLNSTRFRSLPSGLSCRSLVLTRSRVETVPDDAVIVETLTARDCLLRTLPDRLRLEGRLVLDGTDIVELPADELAADIMVIDGKNITRFPLRIEAGEATLTFGEGARLPRSIVATRSLTIQAEKSACRGIEITTPALRVIEYDHNDG
jgi:hypothetical protein